MGMFYIFLIKKDQILEETNTGNRCFQMLNLKLSETKMLFWSLNFVNAILNNIVKYGKSFKSGSEPTKFK